MGLLPQLWLMRKMHEALKREPLKELRWPYYIILYDILLRYAMLFYDIVLDYIWSRSAGPTPPPPPQRVWVHRGLYVQGGLVCYMWSSPRPPLWVGGACLYVHACMGVCMYLYVSMYVCIYSMPRPPLWVGGGRVCMYMHVWVYVCISL